MTTYLACLDDYTYTKIYQYLWHDVMYELITDHAHVRTYMDTFYSTDCLHKLYPRIHDIDLTQRLFIFYIVQIRNGKLRRGSDMVKQNFLSNLVELSLLTTYNNPKIHLTPLYQMRFGSLFQMRNGHPPPVVEYLMRTILYLNPSVNDGFLRPLQPLQPPAQPDEFTEL